MGRAGGGGEGSTLEGPSPPDRGVSWISARRAAKLRGTGGEFPRSRGRGSGARHRPVEASPVSRQARPDTCDGRKVPGGGYLHGVWRAEHEGFRTGSALSCRVTDQGPDYVVLHLTGELSWDEPSLALERS